MRLVSGFALPHACGDGRGKHFPAKPLRCLRKPHFAARDRLSDAPGSVGSSGRTDPFHGIRGLQRGHCGACRVGRSHHAVDNSARHKGPRRVMHQHNASAALYRGKSGAHGILPSRTACHHLTSRARRAHKRRSLGHPFRRQHNHKLVNIGIRVTRGHAPPQHRLATQIEELLGLVASRAHAPARGHDNY